MLSPLAVRLLQLRDLARTTPERCAQEVIDPDMVALMAPRAGQSPATLTVGDFWIEVARMGGYLARKGDGPPGWKTHRIGWLHLQVLLQGVHLASHLKL